MKVPAVRPPTYVVGSGLRDIIQATQQRCRALEMPELMLDKT